MKGTQQPQYQSANQPIWKHDTVGASNPTGNYKGKADAGYRNGIKPIGPCGIPERVATRKLTREHRKLQSGSDREGKQWPPCIPECGKRYGACQLCEQCT